MEFAVYGMNVKGEIATLATYESEEKALRGLELYQSYGAMVFYHKAHWFWIAEHDDGTIDMPAVLEELQENLKSANEYR